MAPSQIRFDDAAEEPLPKQLYETARAAMVSEGYNVQPAEAFTVGKTERSEMGAGAINPAFMVGDGDLDDVIRTGVAFPFNYSEEASKTAGSGRDTGKSHMTSTVVNLKLTAEETVKHLAETGQLALAVAKVKPYCENGENAADVVAYAVATYAKGWLAEKILTATDRFSKGSQSNDEAGQDVFDTQRGEYRQVKCVTDRENDYENCLYYQWDMRGGLWYGDDFKEVNKAAGEVSGKVVPYTGEITPTTTLRTHTSYTHNGRTYRYIWW